MGHVAPQQEIGNSVAVYSQFWGVNHLRGNASRSPGSRTLVSRPLLHTSSSGRNSPPCATMVFNFHSSECTGRWSTLCLTSTTQTWHISSLFCSLFVQGIQKGARLVVEAAVGDRALRMPFLHMCPIHRPGELFGQLCFVGHEIRPSGASTLPLKQAQH